MNDLQKKFAIVGSTAFIVWFLIGLENGGFDDLFDDDFLYYYITDNWYQTILFITWLGSLIAFNIYKD